jgi:hypothetical protein
VTVAPSATPHDEAAGSARSRGKPTASPGGTGPSANAAHTSSAEVEGMGTKDAAPPCEAEDGLEEEMEVEEEEGLAVDEEGSPPLGCWRAAIDSTVEE